jgi:hypothetical protein
MCNQRSGVVVALVIFAKSSSDIGGGRDVT